MGLLDALNLKPPPPPGPTARDKEGAAGGALQDADFAADAKRRKLADRDARRRGEAIAGTKAEEPGKGPERSPVDEKIDAAVDDFIDAKGKQIRQLNKDTMPGFADMFADMSPEEAFLDDMAKGLASAKAHVEFIEKTLAYAEKVGDVKALAPIAGAAKNLQKISEGVLGGLGKAGKAISTARQIVVFYQALNGFAKASRDMSAAEGQSVEAWVGSLKTLWNASKPFVDTFKDKAFTAAIGGSPAAAAACATMAIVGAQLYVGILTLEQGVKNVNAYFARLHRLTREGPDGTIGGVVEARPDPPLAPSEFSTRAETIASLRQHEERERQQEAQREKNAREASRAEATERSVEAFNETIFPKKYLAYRPLIHDKIYAAFRKVEGDGRCAESDWWDCLVPADEYRTDELGIELRKASIGVDDAGIEVRQFLELKSPCPFFDAVHRGELKKHLARPAKA